MEKSIIWLYNIKSVDEHCLCYPTKKRKTTNAVQFISVKKDEDLFLTLGEDHIPAALRSVFEPAIETL